MQSKRAGVTLLEILMAMLILGLVTGGIFTAFVFGRRVSYRSEAELEATGFSLGMADELRLAVGSTGPTGLRLVPGVWVDDKLANAGAFASQNPKFFPPPGASVPLDGDGNPVVPNPLNLPPQFQAKYQTDPGTASSWTAHGDGRILVVEGLTDLDGDGQTGRDFDTPPNGVDLYRVRLKVKYQAPTS